jgi:hypothetical protein
MFDLDLCLCELHCGVMVTNATRNKLIRLIRKFGVQILMSSILSLMQIWNDANLFSQLFDIAAMF